MDTPTKRTFHILPQGAWRRLPLLGGLLLLGILLAACQHPDAEDVWGNTLQPEPGEIRGLTPEHRRSHPTAMHLDEERREAYIALGGSITRPDDRVAVVDLDDGRLLEYIQVGLRPLDLAVDPIETDRIFVAHPYSPGISVIDKQTRTVVQVLDAPHYLERLAFTSDGSLLLATDRAGDRLLAFNVERETRGYTLEEHAHAKTGPNPEAIEIIRPPDDAGWTDRLVAVTDRHGGSITLVDLENAETRRVDIGGPPLALTSRDGFLFIAGVGPGNGTQHELDGTPETGTADLDSSILVLDLREGPTTVHDDPTIDMIRYTSDTARGDNAPAQERILGGALPRAFHWDETGFGDGPALWVSHHSSDQVQALTYHAPDPETTLGAGVLTTKSLAQGERLSHVSPTVPLGPGNLTDSVHGLYETPPGPRATARIDDLLVTVAQYPEQLHITNLADCPGADDPTAPCTTRTIDLARKPIPYPSGAYERGERLFASAFPSADQDRAAIMCHVDGLDTGGDWALPHRDLVAIRIPRLDEVADNAPWLLDGTVKRPQDYLNATAGDLLVGDGEDPHNLARETPERPNENDTAEGNDTQEANRGDNGTTRFPGARDRLQLLDPEVADEKDWMRLTFAYALGERRVPPPPPFITSPDGLDMARGKRLFEDAQIGCASCHIGGDTPRLLSVEESRDIPRPGDATRIKAPTLTSTWDIERSGLLWDRSVHRIQAALLPTGHPCLEPGETGLDEDWHGDVTGRTCQAIDELSAYLRSLEASR